MTLTVKAKSNNRINTNVEEALKEIKSEKMVTITLLVPLSLRENIKIKAIQNKTNVTNVVIEYLKKYVGVNE